MTNLGSFNEGYFYDYLLRIVRYVFDVQFRTVQRRFLQWTTKARSLIFDGQFQIVQWRFARWWPLKPRLLFFDDRFRLFQWRFVCWLFDGQFTVRSLIFCGQFGLVRLMTSDNGLRCNHLTLMLLRFVLHLFDGQFRLVRWRFILWWALKTHSLSIWWEI